MVSANLIYFALFIPAYDQEFWCQVFLARSGLVSFLLSSFFGRHSFNLLRSAQGVPWGLYFDSRIARGGDEIRL